MKSTYKVRQSLSQNNNKTNQKTNLSLISTPMFLRTKFLVRERERDECLPQLQAFVYFRDILPSREHSP